LISPWIAVSEDDWLLFSSFLSPTEPERKGEADFFSNGTGKKTTGCFVLQPEEDDRLLCSPTEPERRRQDAFSPTEPVMLQAA
jgi:hypothetical protein